MSFSFRGSGTHCWLKQFKRLVWGEKWYSCSRNKNKITSM